VAATEAVRLQVPTIKKLTVFPETVQTKGELEVNTTGEVDDVVAVSVAEPCAVPAGTAAKLRVGVARLTTTVCETEAAAYTLLAATDAVSRHAPLVTKVTVLPETVQTEGEVDVNTTADVDDVVAVSVTELCAVPAGTVAKFSVGVAKLTATDCATEAGPYREFTATEAVSRHVPFVKKFTVLPETVQTGNELEANTIGEVDEVVALNGAEVRAVAGGTVAKVSVGVVRPTPTVCVTEAAA
jgi:hypothetical protein